MVHILHGKLINILSWTGGWIGTSELLKASEEISSADRERIRSAAGALKSRLVLEKWLKKHKWRFVYDELVKVGVNSLQGMADYAEDDEAKLDMLSNFQVKMRFFIAINTFAV